MRTVMFLPLNRAQLYSAATTVAHHASDTMAIPNTPRT
jgi:hypothetical protein